MKSGNVNSDIAPFDPRDSVILDFSERQNNQVEVSVSGKHLEI